MYTLSKKKELLRPSTIFSLLLYFFHVTFIHGKLSKYCNVVNACIFYIVQVHHVRHCEYSQCGLLGLVEGFFWCSQYSLSRGFQQLPSSWASSGLKYKENRREVLVEIQFHSLMLKCLKPPQLWFSNSRCGM